ncbi:pyridoxal-phosphate dependent enzyme [Vibrio porteresiae]|uniref:Pyridoxal-phosphate dependent enzyme n=1 Tax=Vibrio porteresiae DSM 19223 TaxID=1123496 RepID=A0ABZ0QHX6_9VIBR|nr:pyridoxal-phosphate dependent enzyme [Vibrio porteresiae]WPC75322.1 pyridoxal-phosphate dependent enzyme [Vibrio porteresiae DSM 19223]
MKLQHSPITCHQFEQIDFYLKRDDLLHPQFSGNKARKFMSLLSLANADIDTLVGHGSPQANSLYSMAALANLRGWKLDFYVDHIPSWLSQNPIGNYRAALALGANIIATRPTYGCSVADYLTQQQWLPNQLFVPEGGRSPIAQSGVNQLAQEILAWMANQPSANWVVALPSGTGTTALYLHQALKQHHIEVVTCACVGGDDYLREQWLSLGEQSHPTILSNGTKHQFGHLYPEQYDLWQKLGDQTEVEFELLYDPLMWQRLLEWWPTQTDRQLLYIHQGGILGNESMLPRYRRQRN